MSTKELADFATGIRYESLPSEVIAKAKASVRDFLGVALYVSRNTPWGQTVASFAIKQGYGASVPRLLAMAKRPCRRAPL
ncbi:MmgE/PrpD family protein [Thermodesulfobacteriota bacterium]